MKNILFIILLIVGCKREYSCEDCKESNLHDTLYNDLKIKFDVYIKNPSTVRAIYPQVQTKLHPGHYRILETIRMDTSHYYSNIIDLKNYHNMVSFFKGDTFFFKCEIRNNLPPSDFVNFDTLVY